MAVLVNELREARLQEAKGREEDRAARAKELELLAHRKEPGSIFKITPQADFPIFGDKDTDVEAHMEDFEDLFNLANPVGGVSGPERLRLLGKTLAGDRLRCYRSIVKASRRTGQYTSDPNKVFEQVVLALYSTFHETDEARAMKAKRKYDCLEKGSESYQQFSVAWVESLAELEDAGVEKSEKDLFLDFLQKCGEQLKITVLRDRRFWPDPATKEPVFRRARTWQEAATIAKESCVVDETSRALTDKGFQSTTVAAESPSAKGGGERRSKDQKNDEI